MCGLLLFLFIGLPVAELWVLIEVGSRIGSLNAIVLVFVTAGLGLFAARRQGMRTVVRLRAAADQGNLGDDATTRATLLEGPLLALGALLLVVPGYLTDAVGLVLLLPPVRRLVARRLVRSKAASPSGAPTFSAGVGPGGDASASTPAPVVIVLNRWAVRTRGPAQPPGEHGAEPPGEHGAEPSCAPDDGPSRESGAERSTEHGAEPSPGPGGKPPRHPGLP